MELTQYVENLRRELTIAAEVGGEDARALADRLLPPLDAAVRLTLLEALSAAAEDITARLGDTVVEVRLADGEPAFVVTTAPPEVGYDEPAAAPPAEGEPGTARLTLRLPDSLKARIEAAAARDSVSVNTWLVRAAGRALETPARGRQATGRWSPGQRITGYARS